MKIQRRGFIASLLATVISWTNDLLGGWGLKPLFFQEEVVRLVALLEPKYVKLSKNNQIGPCYLPCETSFSMAALREVVTALHEKYAQPPVPAPGVSSSKDGLLYESTFWKSNGPEFGIWVRLTDRSDSEINDRTLVPIPANSSEDPNRDYTIFMNGIPYSPSIQPLSEDQDNGSHPRFTHAGTDRIKEEIEEINYINAQRQTPAKIHFIR